MEGKKPAAQISAHAPLLRQLLKTSTDAAASRRKVLALLERLLTPGTEVFKKAQHVYKALYDGDLLPEEDLIAWHAKAAPPGSHGAQLREAVAPFVAWLQEAEEDSDD